MWVSTRKINDETVNSKLPLASFAYPALVVPCLFYSSYIHNCKIIILTVFLDCPGYASPNTTSLSGPLNGTA